MISEPCKDGHHQACSLGSCGCVCSHPHREPVTDEALEEEEAVTTFRNKVPRSAGRFVTTYKPWAKKKEPSSGQSS